MAQELPFPRTPFSFEQCLEAALRAMPGAVLSAEREEKMGVPYYEFEIRARADRIVWEAECSADTGEVVQVERDVKPDDFAFTSVARLALADAVRIAREKVPGTATAIEYEVSPDGRAWYEVTVKQINGKQWEVMVDAVTGAVIGLDHDAGSRTLYRIGREAED